MKAIGLIKEKINAFIKKYYYNRLIKGGILFAALALFIYLFLVLTEYYSYMSSEWRVSLIAFGILLTVTWAIYFIIIPIGKLLHITGGISVREAAYEISARLPEIKDKLLNIIDLESRNTEEAEMQLLAAAIEQKSAEIRMFDFKKAVDFKVNYKYLRYLMVVLIILAGLMISNPAIISESTHRLIHYDKHFEKPTMVRMQLLNEQLTVKRGNDIELRAVSVGKVNPSEVYINFSEKRLRMKSDPTNPGEFVYNLRNLNNSFQFKITAGDYASDNFSLEVLSPPIIKDFKITVVPPKYTAVNDTVYRNIGDVQVPAGSSLTWEFNTLATDSLMFRMGEEFRALTRNDNFYKFSKQIIHSTDYSVLPVNQYFKSENNINYTISVIPDLYPQISVEQKQDSTQLTNRFFRGYIQDDYGISGLVFKYRILSLSDRKPVSKYKSYRIPADNSTGRQEFYYSFDFSQPDINENHTVEYYFEVKDNDAVHGPKTSKSQSFYYTVPTYKEQLERSDNINESAQSSVSRAKEKARQIQESLKEYQKKSMDGSAEDWEKKQFVQDLAKKQNQLKDLLEDAKKQVKKAQEASNTEDQDEELAKKMEELQKLTEELLTDDIRKLMEEINKLAQQFDEKVMEEILKQQAEQFKDLDKMLDRNLELLKRYKVEQKVDQVSEEMIKLSDKMKDLSEQTKQKEQSNEDLSKQQKDLEEKFDLLKQQYEDIRKENKDLEKPYPLKEFNEESEQIKKEFSESQEMLEKGKNKKSSESQEQNSQNMKKLGEKMQQMMQSSGMKMNRENMQQLKSMAQDLLQLSFKQETNYKNVQKININDPKFSDYGEQQIQLQNEYEIVADSLYALSKRMFNLANVINKETEQIERNFTFALQNFREKKSTNAVTGQVKIMQSLNNLVLLLSELIEQMENMQATGSSSDGGDPNNPQPAFDGLKQQQQQLKKQLQDMLEQMKQGKEPGQMPSSKQIAEMLARQEIFRQKLQEMKSKHSLGQETKKLLDEISELTEQNEEKLMNKQITPELLERQQLIQTRLLEAEEAENKRKTDPKRESNTAREKDYRSPEDVFKDETNDTFIKENLNKNSIILNSFYRKLFEKYSNSLNENN
jgi:hypothetical protein